jgi:hypothetical protein
LGRSACPIHALNNTNQSLVECWRRYGAHPNCHRAPGRAMAAYRVCEGTSQAAEPRSTSPIR